MLYGQAGASGNEPRSEQIHLILCERPSALGVVSKDVLSSACEVSGNISEQKVPFQEQTSELGCDGDRAMYQVISVGEVPEHERSGEVASIVGP